MDSVKLKKANRIKSVLTGLENHRSRVRAMLNDHDAEDLVLAFWPTGQNEVDLRKSELLNSEIFAKTYMTDLDKEIAKLEKEFKNL